MQSLPEEVQVGYPSYLVLVKLWTLPTGTSRTQMMSLFWFSHSSNNTPKDMLLLVTDEIPAGMSPLLMQFVPSFHRDVTVILGKEEVLSYS